MSVRALGAILTHDAAGREARWQRYTAELLFHIASGKHIDPDRTQRFGEILEDVYRNPFERAVKKPESAEEIKTYIVGKLEELL